MSYEGGQLDLESLSDNGGKYDNLHILLSSGQPKLSHAASAPGSVLPSLLHSAEAVEGTAQPVSS